MTTMKTKADAKGRIHHLPTHRKGDGRDCHPYDRRKRRGVPAKEYAPGHFLRAVHAWFGADWKPQWPTIDGFAGTVNWREALHRAQVREQQAAEGRGWGTGTIQMTGTPKRLRPAWMGKAGANRA